MILNDDTKIGWLDFGLKGFCKIPTFTKYKSLKKLETCTVAQLLVILIPSTKLFRSSKEVFLETSWVFKRVVFGNFLGPQKGFFGNFLGPQKRCFWKLPLFS